MTTDWLPQWLIWVLALVAIAAGMRVTFRAFRQLWQTTVASARHHELPGFVGQIVLTLVVGVGIYLYFFKLRGRAAVAIRAVDVLEGIGFASLFVVALVKAKRRSYEATEILSAAVFDDGACAWCGIGVDGKRVSRAEYRRLWAEEGERYRIRGHFCESCNSLSCFSCRAAAAGWIENPQTSRWESAQKATCAKCHNGRSLKLVVEPASLHESGASNRSLGLS